MKLAAETRVKAAEREVLELAVEDYQGLWEVRSQVGGATGRHGREVREIGARAVGDLLERGWVRLFRAAGGRTPRR